MTKQFVIIIIAVIIGVNFISTLAQRQDFGGGQVGNGLITGHIPDDGLINNLLAGLSTGSNDLLCTLVGPDFLRVVLTLNRCPSGILLPTLFKSYKSYCDFFNRQPAIIKQCLSDAATRVNVGLNGIVKFDILLGICCKSCNTKNFEAIPTFGGQLGHDALRIGISSEGLVGELANNLFDTTNHLVCSLLGPNFLQLLLNECKNCPSRVLLQTPFKSYDDFCELFNRLSANGKKCYTDGAIRITGPSIFRIDYVIGHCCARCTNTGNDLPQSPPSCKSTNGNILTGTRGGT